MKRVGLVRADRPLDRGQRVGLAAALGGGRVGGEVDHDRGGAGEGRDVDAVAAVELVVAGAAVEHVAAVVAVQRVVAAQALEVVVAGEAGEVVGGVAAGDDVVVGGGAGRERLVDLDRADVGQAAGGQRALGGAELAEAAGGDRVGGGEGGVGDGVLQRHDALGAELAAAGGGVDRGEQAGRRHVFAVAGDRALNVAAEDVVAVAYGDRAGYVRVSRGRVARYGAVPGDDAVGDGEPARGIHQDSATE